MAFPSDWWDDEPELELLKTQNRILKTYNCVNFDKYFDKLLRHVGKLFTDGTTVVLTFVALPIIKKLSSIVFGQLHGGLGSGTHISGK